MCAGFRPLKGFNKVLDVNNGLKAVPYKSDCDS